MKIAHLVLFLNLLSNILIAQTDSLPARTIEPITVTATRMENDKTNIPMAISLLSQDRIQKGQSQLSLHDAIMTMPGVFVQNPDNFAQDMRISIRGFGARAAFGVRGIRIVTDGIPESTPDGQSDVDNLDAGSMQRLEILRGGASALYGNASGGVIALTTEDPTDKPFLEAQALAGSYDLQRFQVKTGFKKEKIGVFLSIGHNRTNGYRVQSAMRQTISNAKIHYQIRPQTRLTLLLNYGNSPTANDPGGLTSEQVQQDRRQARAANLQFNAGETVEQGRVGLLFDTRWQEKNRLILRGFITARDFEGYLAFRAGGVVNFNRLFGGIGVQYQHNTQIFNTPYRLQIGVDIDRQRDHRQRFNNINGKRDSLTFDQNERFGGVGAYIFQEAQFFKKIYLNMSFRYDNVRLSASDIYLKDGDQSGDIYLDKISPMLGLVFKNTENLSFYTNISSNFETPTLNELSANPSNAGGFNTDLKPQQAINYEVGMKARYNQLSIETALFYIDLKNEFVPYQLAAFPGRTFFRNAGKSRRQGIEIGVSYMISKSISAYINYTYSDFKYKIYPNFEGKTQPGIPVHIGFVESRWVSPKGIFLIGQWRMNGDFYADDANNFKNSAYNVLILRGGYTLHLKKITLEPFFAINNIFNKKYNANVQINAAANRFFEPAALANFYAGLKVRFQATN
jgi:iron complex outermembrane recepter protein